MELNASPQLRKYVPVACNKCREAHRCCDGEIPCRRCRARNLQCVYEKSRDKPRRIIDKNSEYIYTQNIAIENDLTAQASPSSLNLPSMDVNIYLNFYALEFNKTAQNSLTPVACQLLPQSLPLSFSTIRDDRKFRVCATLSLTALTLGHVQQGHALMDQTKKYLPEALTMCTLDAAIGFIGLASCYMMEFQLTPTVNYLNLSKSVTSALWKMRESDHNKNIIDVMHTAPVIVHSITRSLQLNLTSFNSDGNFTEAVKGTQKKLDQLKEVVQKSEIPFSDVINLANGLFSLYMADVGGVFQAIENIELAARNLSYKWQEHSNIFVHLVRSLKFALLRDELAMRNECGLLLQLFDRLRVHNCTSLSTMYTTALLWSALELENELQLLVLIAKRMSLSFPGGKFIVERFSKQTSNGSDTPQWNPFCELIAKFRAINNAEQIVEQPATPPTLDPAAPYLLDEFAFDQLDNGALQTNDGFVETFF